VASGIRVGGINSLAQACAPVFMSLAPDVAAPFRFSDDPDCHIYQSACFCTVPLLHGIRAQAVICAGLPAALAVETPRLRTNPQMFDICRGIAG
jgi:hypothetical protein